MTWTSDLRRHLACSHCGLDKTSVSLCSESMLSVQKLLSNISVFSVGAPMEDNLRPRDIVKARVAKLMPCSNGVSFPNLHVQRLAHTLMCATEICNVRHQVRPQMKTDRHRPDHFFETSPKVQRCWAQFRLTPALVLTIEASFFGKFPFESIVRLQRWITLSQWLLEMDCAYSTSPSSPHTTRSSHPSCVTVRRLRLL